MQEELLFCPLGGSGEIGMNMNLFAYGKPDDQKWIMVDIGVTFADDSLPGIDLIYPDPGFIIDKKDKLLGIILTHAHEDHIGAIAYVWPKLKCKILLQIHDELIFEVIEEEVNNYSKIIKDEMSSVKDSDLHSFSLPLSVDINAGDNWGDLH